MDSNLFSLSRSTDQIDDFRRKYTITWSIPDFIWLLNNQTNREIRTKNLDNHEDNECTFQVKIQFVGQENDLIEIYYMAHESVFVEPTCNMFVKERGYCLISEKHVKQYQLVHKNEWQLLAVQMKRLIKDQNRLSNNTMRLRFEFLVCQSNNNLKRDQPYLPANEEDDFDLPHSDLCNDVTSLLMNMSLSDVTVKSLQGDSFPAHKILLITRSAVLKANFEHSTVESLTNTIEFPFETDVVKDVLSYIYTDQAPQINELSAKLLKAADYYQLNGLKKLCEIALEKKLTIDNAIETLELANLHQVMYLKKKTLAFIKDGLAGDVTETEGWKTLQSAEIVKSVYECVVRNKLA